MRHMTHIHIDEGLSKKYLCTYCGRKFKTNQQRGIHIRRIHSLLFQKMCQNQFTKQLKIISVRSPKLFDHILQLKKTGEILKIKSNLFGYSIYQAKHIYYWCMVCDCNTGTCVRNKAKKDYLTVKTHYSKHHNALKRGS